MTQVKEGLCFGCRDYLEFQFHGQTPDYPDRARQLQHDYIQQYVDSGLPVISCSECHGIVRYVQRDDGKWYEVRDAPQLPVIESDDDSVTYDITDILKVMKDDE